MPFPAGWPPRVPQSTRSIRFYVKDTATAAFTDKAYLFADQASANTYVPTPYLAPGSNATITLGATPYGTGQDLHDATATVPKMIWAKSIRICNDGSSDLEFSFDGINVHGVVTATEKQVIYRDRWEAGISVRGSGQAYRIEAW